MSYDTNSGESDRERSEKRVLKSLAANGPTGVASPIALRALRNKYPEVSRTLPVHGPKNLYPRD